MFAVNRTNGGRAAKIRLRSPRGFTLPELLIVVAIIAILVSIIVPAAGRARELSQRTVCMNRVRGLAQASIAFATEHKGQLPNPNWISIENRDPNGWLYKAPLPSNPPPDIKKTGQLWKYLGGDGDSYFCPTFDRSITTGNSDHVTSYLMNGAVGGYGSIPSPMTSYNLRQFPPDAIIFWEGTETYFNDGSSYPTEVKLAVRHPRGATVSYFDGSADFITYDYWLELLTKTPGPLYCSPRTANGQ
jgi:prepilin-type N-terminal cleavage/methylation domain-containing protein/prepilin-type processing-associated H-X9-DG protein